ncbi:hypothetical protein D3C85_939570 [compost metagenome]
MLGKEGLGEAHQLGDGLVKRVGPPTGERKAVGGFAFAALAGLLLQVSVAYGIAVVFGQRAIADHEQLHVLEQATARPEAVALVAIDLVEGFADIHPAALELDMHHRQAIDQHCHIEARSVFAAVLAGWRFVLVDHLQDVVMDIGLVDQVDVLAAAVIALQDLDVVFLQAGSFFQNAVIATSNAGREEALPLGVGKLDIVELLQLGSQVGDQLGLRADRQVFIGLTLQLLDKGTLQRRLALVASLAHTQRIRQKLGNHRALIGE